jgi:hypothetical protein
MSSAGFEPTISEGERLQTYALDCAATGIRISGSISKAFSSIVKAHNVVSVLNLKHQAVKTWEW